MITYIDMDGVLVDFYRGAHEYMGVEIKEEYPYTVGDWYWVNDLGFDYEKCDSEFWENLPICSDAQRWLSIGDPKTVVTVPCGIASVVGKTKWLERHFPEMKIIFMENKYLLAQEGRLLIDDSEGNINEFFLHGGAGILVPRPWNMKG